MSGLDANALLLLHMDGSDDGTVITDSSSSALTASVVGPAVTDTGDKVFGTAAAHCLNTLVGNSITAQGYVSVAYEAGIDPSGGPFTVDFRFKVDEILYGCYVFFFNRDGMYGDTFVGVTCSSGTPRLSVTGSDCWLDFSAYDDNAWHHMAVVGLSGTISVYIDGALVDDDAAATMWSPTSTDPWLIGQNTVGSEVGGITPANGVHIDEFRYSDVARWVTTFTPPLAEYTTDATNDRDGVFAPMDSEMLGGATLSGTFQLMSSEINGGADLTGSFLPMTSEMLGGVSMSGSFASLQGEMTTVYPITVDMDQEFSPMTSEMGSGVTMSGSFQRMTGLAESYSLITGSMECSFSLMTSEAFSGARVEETFARLTGSIQSSTVMTGDLSGTFAPMQSDMHGLTGIIGSMESVFKPLTGEASASTAISVSMSGSFAPMQSDMHSVHTISVGMSGSFRPLESEMIGSSGISAAMDGVFALLQSYMTSITAATAPQTFCMNLLKKELVSKFTNYGFNSYGMINKKPVGASSSGLYLLEGTTDNGTAIISTVKTPDLDFGSYLLKKLRAMNIGGRLDGKITVTANNGTLEWSFTVDVSGMKPGQVRGFFPHAARGEYLNFTFTNPEGADFVMDGISLYAMILERCL